MVTFISGCIHQQGLYLPRNSNFVQPVHTKHLSGARPFVGTGGTGGMKTSQCSKSEFYLVMSLEFWIDVSVLNDRAQFLTAQHNFFLPFPLIYIYFCLQILFTLL